jgi:heat shock protein HspQ
LDVVAVDLRFKHKRDIRTTTSLFGAPGRVKHDASGFYGRQIYDGAPDAGSGEEVENELPESTANPRPEPYIPLHRYVIEDMNNVNNQYIALAQHRLDTLKSGKEVMLAHSAESEPFEG